MGREWKYITAPAKSCRVLYDVDVVVAGSGLCGTFAAISAGRCGARTVVIERFGMLGGNIGPGMLVMGSLYGEAQTSLPGGLAGIAEEFVERLKALRTGAEPSRGSENRDYPYTEEANIASFVAQEMMQEAGVERLLSAEAADPIIEDGVVRGVFGSKSASRDGSSTMCSIGTSIWDRRATEENPRASTCPTELFCRKT